MSVLKLSKPTQDQLIHGIERVLAVFIVATVGAWQVVPDKFSKAGLIGAVLAGITAVYQLLLSSTTKL